ncbi:MAG: Hpt domain-containing protein, partial [Pseudomonadota bacterium]
MAFDIRRFIGRFVEEARDHLGKLTEGIETLTRQPGDRDAINALFRSAHTLKGSSRMLKLLTISDTAHRLEDVLGALREGKISFDAELGQLMFRALDTLSALVNGTADGTELPAPDEALCTALTAAASGQVKVIPEVAPPPAESPAIPVKESLRTATTVRLPLAKLDELV